MVGCAGECVGDCLSIHLTSCSGANMSISRKRRRELRHAVDLKARLCMR